MQGIRKNGVRARAQRTRNIQKHFFAIFEFFFVLLSVMNQDIDTYAFIVGFMELYHEDNVPEPKIIQSALYACRRLNNFPMAMRILEMVKVKCEEREDIYNYLMQELQPTFEDLGLTTVEGMGLDQVED